MQKGRLEAFSDGVLAIILTIMVLELKVPHGDSFAALRPLVPIFLSYVLSFVYVGIYWNGGILWPNLHLLFWLSLVPVSTGWMGENHFAPATLAVYGAILLASAVAYSILQYKLIALNGGPNSPLANAVGRDWKGKLSPVLYGVGIVSSFVAPWLAGAVYVGVALMWLVPDRRIERTLHAQAEA
jgi:uncharacterized membrane protein